MTVPGAGEQIAGRAEVSFGLMRALICFSLGLVQRQAL